MRATQGTTRHLRLLVLVLLLALAGCGKAGPRDDGDASAALAARGARLAQTRGCASCHSVDGSTKVGPTWKGLYGARVPLESGATIADEAYLAESIRRPDAETVQGFPRGVMAAAVKPGSIPDAEVRALVAYIRSLR